MKALRLLITGAMIMLLAGCFQLTTIIRVNPDGSGTVEESVLFSNKFIAQIEQMMQSFGNNGEPARPFELFQPDRLKEQARSMGKGVSYLAGEKVTTTDYRGYKARFAFTDISELKLNQQSGSPAGGEAPRTIPLSFSFSKGSPATLTITQPPKPAAEEAPMAVGAEPTPQERVPPPMPDETSKELMEQMLGLKILVAIEVNGTIVSTNAGFRDGQRLTLLSFDLTSLGVSGPELETLSRMRSGSYEEAMKRLKGKPWFKFDNNEKVTVVFGK